LISLSSLLVSSFLLLMLCGVGGEVSFYSSPLPLIYDDCLEAEVEVRDNGRWKKRQVCVYRQRRLSGSTLVIRKKNGGIEREFGLEALCGVMMEQKEGVRFPLLIGFTREIVRIGFKLADSVVRWKRFMEKICGETTSISSLILEHIPFLPPFTTLGHNAAILIMGSRLSIVDTQKEEVVHSAPLTHIELITAIDNSLWISFDDLRKNPDEYFSLESMKAKEILNYFRELREVKCLRFKMLPYKAKCNSRAEA
ncbi:hypothetical protein PFISCL1PPCAC_15177, partial [Pristionchus fissidentatus]